MGVDRRRRGVALSEGRAALFLDRDGVLNDTVWDADAGAEESPLRARDVALLPTAADAVRAASEAGVAVVVVSNQPAAAKGRVNLDVLQDVHATVLRLLADEGARVDASYLCLHHPAGEHPDLGGPCACRKPQPGLLLTARDELGLDLRASWLVGDTDADVGAARAAGLGGVVVVEHAGSAHRRSEVAADADAAAEDAAAAVRVALGRMRSGPRPE